MNDIVVLLTVIVAVLFTGLLVVMWRANRSSWKGVTKAVEALTVETARRIDGLREQLRLLETRMNHANLERLQARRDSENPLTAALVERAPESPGSAIPAALHPAGSAPTDPPAPSWEARVPEIAAMFPTGRTDEAVGPDASPLPPPEKAEVLGSFVMRYCRDELSRDVFLANVDRLGLRRTWIDSTTLGVDAEGPTDLIGVFRDKRELLVVLASKARYSLSLATLFHRSDAQSGQWVWCTQPCDAVLLEDGTVEARHKGRLDVRGS